MNDILFFIALWIGIALLGLLIYYIDSKNGKTTDYKSDL